MTTTAENWLKTQPTTTSEPTAIKSQLKICKVRFFPPIWIMINRNFLAVSRRRVNYLVKNLPIEGFKHNKDKNISEENEFK